MKRFNFKLELALIAPFRFRSIETPASELDFALLTDDNDNLVLPGSHLAGHFRHFLCQIVAMQEECKLSAADCLVSRSDLKRWFGSSGSQLNNAEELDPDFGDDQTPEITELNERGTLTFYDLVADDNISVADENKDVDDSLDRTRIRLSRASGAVERGMMQVIEQRHRPGEIVSFASSPDVFGVVLIGADWEKDRFERAFAAFSQSLTALGGGKAHGYGRLAERRALQYEAKPSNSGSCWKGRFEIGAAAGSANLRLEFFSPLLVDPSFESGNLLRSSDTIPGAALKAAVAEVLRATRADEEFEVLSAGLSEIRISHARLGSLESPPVVPFSCVVYQDERGSDRIGDVYALDGRERGLRFEVDLKQHHRAYLKHLYPPPPVEFVTRTRTAIDGSSRNQVKDGHLFTYQAIRPPTGLESFELRITWPENTADVVRAVLGILESGLVRIGKLRTHLDLSFVRAPPTSRIPRDRHDKRFIRLVLATPGYLLSAERLAEIGPTTSLVPIYRDIVCNSLEEEVRSLFDWTEFDCLVRHEWSGGHRAMRYPQRIENSFGYHPYCLTMPGSIFRLAIHEGLSEEALAQLEAALGRLRMWGLPSAGEEEGWRFCPFVRNNGYGEVVFDQGIASRSVD